MLAFLKKGEISMVIKFTWLSMLYEFKIFAQRYLKQSVMW